MAHRSSSFARPTVLLAVETAARELDSKLVLAAALAGQGCRAMVGHKEVIKAIARRSKGALWQGKSLFSVKSGEHLAEVLAERKSAVMFLSDEGAMHQTDSWVQQTLHKHWVDHFDTTPVNRICVWGRRQKAVLAEHYAKFAELTAVTGSPRFDLCQEKYAWVSAAGAPEQGERPYILICTRFGAVAHGKGMAAPFEIKLNRAAWPSSLSAEDINNVWFSKWRRDVHDFAEFIFLIKEVAAAYPDYRIIVRPHPSESIPFYARAFALNGNVRVDREGNVLNWIRGASLVIHSGSTSGVEAVLAGRPVVNFLPSLEGRKDTDIEVAREAGARASNLNEALLAVAKALEAASGGTALDQPWSAEAASMLNNLDTEAIPILVKETLAVLSEAGIDASDVHLPAGMMMKNAVKNRLGWQRRDSYLRSKRGRIDSQHVERILDGCRTMGFGGASLREATPQLVTIEPS